MIHENPQRADQMITQLSDLMRYAMQSNQADFVALASELQSVRDYLALETIRFEERLPRHLGHRREIPATSRPAMLLANFWSKTLSSTASLPGPKAAKSISWRAAIIPKFNSKSSAAGYNSRFA